MPNRRRFLQAAAIMSAAPAIPVAAEAGGAPHSISLVVYDERFEASRAFGRAALALGARVRRIDGDITALWTGDLQPLWRAGPAVIAGLTTRDALFCLEQIGWDSRMRVAYRADHGAEADSDWPARAAQTLLTQRVALGRPESLGGIAAGVPEERTLYSWIIAPAASRARAAHA